VNFSRHHRVQNGSGDHPASYPMDKGALSLEKKRPGSEADHSPPSSAEVNNAWGYAYIPSIRLHWRGAQLKHRDSSIFTASRTALGPTQSPIQCVPGTLSLGVERPEGEANHSLHLMPRSRMRGAMPTLAQYAFIGVVLS